MLLARNSHWPWTHLSMFRQHTRVAGAYRVTFTPEAWKEVGRLSSALFVSLQETLEQLAQQGRPGTRLEESQTQFTFTIDSLVIHCQRDEKSRTLTLQRLTWTSNGPD